MEALLYFALWAGIIFLMMRFGCGAHIMGHGRGRTRGGSAHGTGSSAEVSWVPPARDTDPVCGKTVATDAAKPSVYDGRVFYFCSRECREAFEAAPDLYVGDGKSDPTKLEHSHA